ncbi:MAG: type II toxin-antitoxin system HigB family toxin [Tepidisphaeraceae bacterium]
MLITGLAAIEGFLKKNASARTPTIRWVELARAATWSDIVAVRETFASADAIKGTNLTCFNIGGNKFRLLTVISYERQQIVIHELMTHAQYDRKYVR